MKINGQKSMSGFHIAHPICVFYVLKCYSFSNSNYVQKNSNGSSFLKILKTSNIYFKFTFFML